MQGKDLKLLIPAALNATYLNAGTLGPTPSTALAAAAASELEWVEAGAGMHQHYIDAKAKVRTFAKRIERRMPGGVVSLTENNSESLLRVLWGTPFQAGDEIITTDHEHGAVVLAISSLMDRFGLTVRVAPAASPEGLAAEVQSRINDRTRLVVMSHVSYLTGWEFPVADVAEVVRAHPACRLLVDGAQALGNIVVNPAGLGADYYVFCGHKWMMSPAGWAGLWVRSDRRADLSTRWPLEPWPVDARALEKGPLKDFSEEGDDFEYGTRGWPRIAGWSVTWDYFEEEGFDEHARYQLELADQARERLNAVEGLAVLDPLSAGTKTTSLMVVTCRQLGSGLYEWLLERNVVAKGQPIHGGIRVSWASFNTSDDLDALMEGVKHL